MLVKHIQFVFTTATRHKRQFSCCLCRFSLWSLEGYSNRKENKMTEIAAFGFSCYFNPGMTFSWHTQREDVGDKVYHPSYLLAVNMTKTRHKYHCLAQRIFDEKNI